jgi:peptidoglycan hydrolase CwlO-like protein
MKEKSDIEKHDSNLSFWVLFLFLVISITTCGVENRIGRVNKKLDAIQKEITQIQKDMNQIENGLSRIERGLIK